MKNPRRKVLTGDLLRLKKEGRPIVVLTAADFMMARILDECEVDVILVGDSLGTTYLGHASTIPVTMRDMIHHSRAVSRAKPRALVVGDLPFGSYHQSTAQGVRNAIRMIREGGCDAVKLEGGVEQADVIRAIVRAGVPVMGHIGLLPQQLMRDEKYRVYGKTKKDEARLLRDLRAVENAGAFSVVLEYITADAARRLGRKSRIPTIGIGSGVDCDGQVLVIADLLGMQSWLNPRAARRYARLGQIMKKAVREYSDDVRHRRFPGKEESF